MMGQITDNLDTETIRTVRQALNGEISADEAADRIRFEQRVTAIERYGVKLLSRRPQDVDRVSRMLGLEL